MLEASFCFSMAVLEEKKLLKLPVETKGGTGLGRVIGFDVELESQSILRWHVRPNGLASRMLSHPLIVSREQVLSISEEKMVVDDAVEKEMELAKAKAIGLVSNVKA
jgi:sporulation protein YlmC with PRC-barrel domain